MTKVESTARSATSQEVTLRQALSALPTGVTVASTVTSTGKPVGLTANSFNVVSLEPPLLLWSLRTSSGSTEAFRSASHFTINGLSEDHLHLSPRFPTPLHNRFETVICRSDPNPILLS